MTGAFPSAPHFPPDYPLRTTVAEIDLTELRRNYRLVRERACAARVSGAPPEIMPVVKADAYGHGVVPCSRALLEEGAAVLGVAFAAEAAPLRAAVRDIPVETSIAVVTPPFAHGAAEYCRLNLEFCVASVETARAFSAEAEKTGRKLKAHLTLDTGMRRDGIEPEEAVEFMRALGDLRGIEIHGVCTHFATADEADKAFFLRQVERFRAAVCALADAGYRFRYVHAANSGAIADGGEASLFTLARPGIILYGYNPSPEILAPIPARPVMTLSTSIISLRRISAGEPVSYGRRYCAARETTIATIPIGYADGLRRGLTGKARVRIRGEYYPIVGTICMDQCMVDVGDAPFAVGEPVHLFGGKIHRRLPQNSVKGDSDDASGESVGIDANEWAQSLETIPYEILTGVSVRVPRVYYDARDNDNP
jgi:alanine racemase